MKFSYSFCTGTCNQQYTEEKTDDGGDYGHFATYAAQSNAMDFKILYHTKYILLRASF